MPPVARNAEPISANLSVFAPAANSRLVCNSEMRHSYTWAIVRESRARIIWDGLRSHRSRMVWDFVRQQRGRLWLESLPAYAPELNPVEYLWSHWKQHELPNFCPQSFGELSYYARRALRRMRRRPTLVGAFWEQAELFPF